MAKVLQWFKISNRVFAVVKVLRWLGFSSERQEAVVDRRVNQVAL